MDTHAFKRSLHHSERYNRRGFGRAEEVAESLEEAYQSGLISRIRDNGYKLSHGRLTVRLAEAFGHVLAVAGKAGKLVGTFAMDGEGAHRASAAGARLLVLSSELALLKQAGTEASQGLKRRLQQP